MERAPLIDRAANANRSARKICAESFAVTSRARFLLVERQRASSAVRSAGRPSANSVWSATLPSTEGLRYDFEIRGVISGQPVSATLRRDRLRCDPLLRAHADLVVALGETFPYGDRALPATLDGSPAQILLTLMRAMNVTKLALCLEPQGFVRRVSPS
jgi:hypothetical protein